MYKFLALTLILSTLYFIPLSASAAIVKPANNLGLVGYWSFNEGTSTTAADYSGRGNKGTLSGATLPTWVSGKLGNALSFNGSSSYVSSGFTGLSSASAFTISAWIKRPTTGTKGPFISAYDDCDNRVEYEPWSDDNFYLILGCSIYGSFPYTATAWTHIVAVYDGTQSGNSARLKIYQNGIQQSLSFTGIIPATAPTIIAGLVMGREGIANFSSGSMDDARIYNRALSGTEVAYLYQTGATKFGASSRTLGSGSTLNNGLVGQWTFDGGNISGVTATDSSGQGNNGTLTNSPIKVQGKLGQALNFNGSSSYVSVGINSFGSQVNSSTFSAWVKTTDTSAIKSIMKVINDGVTMVYGIESNREAGACDLTNVAGSTLFYIRDNNGTQFAKNITTNIYDDKWHHIVWRVLNASSNSMEVYVDGVSQTLFGTCSQSPSNFGNFDRNVAIGASNNRGSIEGYLNGSVDDVRIYNRALTAGEVAQLYQQGGGKTNASGQTLQNGSTLSSGLTSYWSFNGPDITDKIYDRIGGLNGYVFTAATTSAKVPGKLGQAMNFNGSGSIKNFSSSISSVGSRTVCAWFKTTTTARQGILGTRPTAASTGFIFTVNRTTAGNLSYIHIGGSELQVAAGITTGKWYHACATLDASAGAAALYLDGGLIGSQGASFTAESASAFNGVIGDEDEIISGEIFSGSLDEVRIYNRALTAAEVKQVYQLGR